MKLHTSTEPALACVHEHLAELVGHLGSPQAVADAFNCLPGRLFALVYDPQFGVWLLRPAS